MGHQAEVVDTLGEAVVLISTKPGVEGARTAVVKTVQVCLVGTQTMTVLCKLMNGWAEFKTG